jgi:omega-6 fatty acid desaturase (delta-12 desaturase)
LSFSAEHEEGRMDINDAALRGRNRGWREIVAPYERHSDAYSGFQLATTWLPLAALCILAHLAMSVSPWIASAIAVPVAGLLVRTFILMHDCGHGSFFSSRQLNGIVGWLSGVITMTPFTQWRHDHALHHASSGDLGRRGHGDVKTLTVREFVLLSPMARFGYRLLRHPLVLLGLGPLHLIVTQRIRPRGTPIRDPETWSVWSTNAGIALMLAGAARLAGWGVVIFVYLPAIYLAAAMGIWLFYVQHQFEGTYWQPHGDWDYLSASIRGSSYLKLPSLFRWITGDIGVHHVHHLSPRIPNYRLRQCHDENAVFHSVTTLTPTDTLRTFRLALWDEDRRRLVSFADAESANDLGHPAAH